MFSAVSAATSASGNGLCPSTLAEILFLNSLRILLPEAGLYLLPLVLGPDPKLACLSEDAFLCIDLPCSLGAVRRFFLSLIFLGFRILYLSEFSLVSFFPHFMICSL